VLAAERKVTSKLLEQDTSAEKLYILNEYVYPSLLRALKLTEYIAT
jgi:20S proteasome alpha/beta subunit